MGIQVIRDHLDIVALQERMNGIVFDYMDTSNNHAKAIKELKPLFTQVTSFFKNYVDNREGELPTANTYWHLFIDCSAKLSFFLASANFHASKENELSSEQLAQLSKLTKNAALSLPGIEREENAVFLDDVLALYTEISKDSSATEVLRGEVEEQRGNLNQCIQQFMSFVEDEN